MEAKSYPHQPPGSSVRFPRCVWSDRLRGPYLAHPRLEVREEPHPQVTSIGFLNPLASWLRRTHLIAGLVVELQWNCLNLKWIARGRVRLTEVRLPPRKMRDQFSNITPARQPAGPTISHRRTFVRFFADLFVPGSIPWNGWQNVSFGDAAII